MRTPRSMTFGSYHTHADGLWTLTSWELSAATYKQNLVEIPGSSKLLDLSTSLTDGEPTYSSRTLKATFESSEGNRLARKERINKMINMLDGYSMNIVLPDDAEHYLVGRLSVRKIYNDMAHASVEVTAVCEPWKYAKGETVVVLTTTGAEQEATLTNSGRLSVVPTLVVTGANVSLKYGWATWTLSPGTYELPDLYLTPGEHVITYTGEAFNVVSVLEFTYREAVL